MNASRLMLDPTAAKPPSDRRHLLLLGILYGIMAQIYTNLYFKLTIDQGSAGLNALANFTAARPYQYRILVPALVHLLAKLTGADIYQVTALYQYVELIAAFAAFWVFRAYLSTFVDLKTASLLSFALLPVMLLIHVSCAMCHYPYDTPEIVFFTLGLCALRARNWPLFYAALAVGTLNRESNLLLVAAFGLIELGEMPASKLALHLAAQGLIFAAIKLSVDRLFAGNPGSFTEDHTQYNSWLLHEALTLRPVIAGTALAVAGMIGLIVFGRRALPAFVLRLLWLAPLFVAIMYQVGILDEVRAYNEMVPILLTPLLLILNTWLGAAPAAQSAGDGMPEKPALRPAA